MFSFRPFAVTLLTAAVAAAAAPARADDRIKTFASPSSAAGVTRDGGVLDGIVTSVDYQRRVLTINAAKRGSVDISVPPTVPVQGAGSAYQSLNDVKSGQHVQVYTSQKGSVYTAQIINLCQKSCP